MDPIEGLLTREKSKASPVDGMFSRLLLTRPEDRATLTLDMVERPPQGMVADHPAIEPPDDFYWVKWTEGVHPKHPEVYEIMNVKGGRTAILWHSANVWEQLLGCQAPGLSVGRIELTWEGKIINHLGVLSSKQALEDLIAFTDKRDVKLKIVEV